MGDALIREEEYSQDDALRLTTSEVNHCQCGDTECSFVFTLELSNRGHQN